MAPVRHDFNGGGRRVAEHPNRFFVVAAAAVFQPAERKCVANGTFRRSHFVSPSKCALPLGIFILALLRTPARTLWLQWGHGAALNRPKPAYNFANPQRELIRTDDEESDRIESYDLQFIVRGLRDPFVGRRNNGLVVKCCNVCGWLAVIMRSSLRLICKLLEEKAKNWFAETIA